MNNRKNYSEINSTPKIEAPSDQVEQTSYMTTTSQRKALVASDIQRIGSMMRFMLQYIRQADVHIHQLEHADRNKETKIREMETCINEMQAEIEELMSVNENLIQIELAEQQKVIESNEEEILRQRQLLDIFMNKGENEPSSPIGREKNDAVRDLIEASDKQVARMQLVLDKEREMKKEVLAERDGTIQKLQDEVRTLKLVSESQVGMIDEHR